MADAHATIISKAPKSGKKKENSDVSKILTGIAEKPSFRETARTPAGKYKNDPPKEKKEQLADQEAEKQKLVSKINKFLQSEILGPILAQEGFNVQQAFPMDAPYEVAEMTYKRIKNILGQRGVKDALRKNIPRVNVAVEGALCTWGFDVRGFSESFQENIDLFAPELEELSIEISSSYGGAGLALRLGAKYVDLLYAQKQFNDQQRQKELFSKTDVPAFTQAFQDKLGVAFADSEFPVFVGTPEVRKQKQEDSESEEEEEIK